MTERKKRLLEAGVTIRLEKKPGEAYLLQEIQATSSEAAIHAIALLIGTLAKDLDISSGRVLSLLAVKLLGEEEDENHERTEL